ncbi:MAG: nitrogen regulation protein NR(II) [Arenicellales bacterium]|nr:nitrogen regulation protein NR(II) [Arenicellales bacterium]
MISERQAHMILDRLNTAILTCDPDLNVTQMNPAGELMFGTSSKQAHLKPLSALVPGQTQTFTWPAQKALESNQPVTVHDVTLKLPGDRCIKVDYTVTPIEENDDSRLLIELLQVDGFLEIARDQYRMDQYSANRDVLRGLAHEVKNPLGGLRGAAQLLERELSDRDVKQYTRIIIHEADRLSNLVDRMMGSYGSADPTAVNIHEILEHVRKLILVEIQEGITIERDYDPSLPQLHGDKDQLIQAVLNIVRNSVDAINKKGTIKFRTRVERSVYVGQQWYRCVIRVDIEDNGPGIPEHMHERIFYPMVTGRPEGSGLGLSIAQNIIRNHQGSIQLHSEPGYTRFSLLLPFNTRGKANES